MVNSAVNKYKNIGKVSGEIFKKQKYQGYTELECDFLYEKLTLKKGDQLLDIGCGTGRHLIEFSKRGIRGVGIDISDHLLEIGRRDIVKHELPIKLIECNAIDFKVPGEFDSVISIYTGAFGLLESEQDNLKILRNISESLKPLGTFAIMVRNAIYCINREVEKGSIVNFKENQVTSTVSIESEGGNSIKENLGWYSYTYKEMKYLLAQFNLNIIDVYDGEIGKFGYEEFTNKSKEMIIIGYKKE